MQTQLPLPLSPAVSIPWLLKTVKTSNSCSPSEGRGEKTFKTVKTSNFCPPSEVWRGGQEFEDHLFVQTILCCVVNFIARNLLN